MKECKQCGNIVANDKNVCDNCHHTLNAGEFIYICNKCGRIFGENDKVCPNCHTKPEIIVANATKKEQNVVKRIVNEQVKQNLALKPEESTEENHLSKIFKLLSNQKKIILAVLVTIIIVVSGINFVLNSKDIKFLEFRNMSESVNVYSRYSEDIKLNDDIGLTVSMNGLNPLDRKISIVDLKNNKIIDDFDPERNDTINIYQIITEEDSSYFWLLRGSRGSTIAKNIWIIGPGNNGKYGIVFESSKELKDSGFAEGIRYNKIDAQIKDNKIYLNPSYRNKKYENNFAELTWDSDKNKFDCKVISSENSISDSDKKIVKENNVNVPKNKGNKLDESVASVQNLLNNKNIKGTVLGVSSGKTINGVVALYEVNGAYNFLVYDNPRDRLVSIGYLPTMKNILGRNKLEFEMFINDDKESNDMKAGYILGNTHVIPVLAEYKVEAGNKIVPGMITVRKGAHGKFDGYLYSQANVDAINAFLMEANQCIEDTIERNPQLKSKFR